MIGGVLLVQIVPGTSLMGRMPQEPFKMFEVVKSMVHGHMVFADIHLARIDSLVFKFH